MELPTYIKIHNRIKKSIENGDWNVGDKIPSERKLADFFKVSRMTLRQAIMTLVDEGILERKVGSGTFIASQKVQETMSGITSFTQIVEEQGKKPSSRTISYLVTTPTLSEVEKLQLKNDDEVVRMERIRYADNVPICFETATIPYSLIKSFARTQITNSLYKTLQDAGMNLGHAKQLVSATNASEKISEYLNVKNGSAMLLLRQITELDNGVPIEYVRTQYVGNRFEFSLER